MALSLRTMARILAATFIINCLIGLHPAYTSGKQFSFERVLSFQWYFKSQRLTIIFRCVWAALWCKRKMQCSHWEVWVLPGIHRWHLQWRYSYSDDFCCLQTPNLTHYHQKHCPVMEAVNQFVMTPVMDVFAPVLTVFMRTELTVMVYTVLKL